MTLVARAWLVLTLVAALADYGGEGDYVRPLLTVAIAIALVLAVFTLRREFHPPPLAWIAVLFLPLSGLTLLQILPLGWHHPWVDGDLAVLGTTRTVWSIDHQASGAALVWFATLGALALTVSLLARGARLQSVIDALLYVAALCAVFALALTLSGITWPSDELTTHTRGPFIYPNHAAAFWAACLPLAAFTAHRRQVLLGWGTVAVLALAILLSGSRGGILVAAAVMLPIAVYLLPRRRRWWWAIGGGVAVAAWLWLIGIAEVTDKFDRLRGEEGATLSGRVLIWQTALPVIQDAGALGSGAGTVTSAFRRGGDTRFTEVVVDHLHSDPLEWWLEYGWLGVVVAVVAIGAVLARLRPHPTIWKDPVRRAAVLGAAGGLLILTVHSCGDFIWHNPIAAMTGVTLVCILALAGQEQQDRRVARMPIRLIGTTVALLALTGVWWTWNWHTGEMTAREISRLVAARQAAHLPLTGGGTFDRARALVPASVRLAGFQVWLAQADGDPSTARAICRSAAEYAPGDAAMWAQRALLAAEAHDAAAMSTALRRALAWAPTWPDIQQVALRLIASQDRNLLPAEQTSAIVLGVLALDRAQPAWFFTLASEVLGEQRLLAAVRDAGPLLARSAEDWLAHNGPLPDWLALRQRLAIAGARLPAALSLVNDRLTANTSWQAAIPLDVEERRTLADRLNSAGLPVPTTLVTALERDGQPWMRWARPVDLLDASTRTELAHMLRSELHRAWARTWADRLAAANGALAGERTMVSRDCDPTILARLAGLSAQADPALVVEETLRRRAAALLERWRTWEWSDLPDGAGRWSWWYGDGREPAVVESDRWAGLVIDGVWIGWVRGNQDIAPLLGRGLRRVALLTP